MALFFIMMTSFSLPLTILLTASLGPYSFDKTTETIITNIQASNQVKMSTARMDAFRHLEPARRQLAFQRPSSSVMQAAPVFTADLNNTLQNLLKLQQIDSLINEYRLSGKNVTVGIIDSGISTEARQKLELHTNVTFKRLVDVTTSSPTIGSAEDSIGTGTQLASLIALIAPSVNFVIYKSVELVISDQDSGKFIINEKESFLLDALTDFVNYVKSNIRSQKHVLIINRSLNSTSSTIKDLLIDLVREKNVTIIVPAGNNPTFSDYQMNPLASLPEVIAVAAFANDTTPLLGTGIGPRLNGLPGPDLASIGYHVPVMLPNGTYVLADGVHLPLGFVAASISMFLEKYPNSSPLKIKATLIKSARLIPTIATMIQGAGFLNAANALSFLNGSSILAVLPRAILDYNRYYTVPVVGMNRTFPIILFYSKDDVNDNNSSLNNLSIKNLSVAVDIQPQPLVVEAFESNPITMTSGVHVVNLTIGSSFDHVMDRYRGNVTLSLQQNGQVLISDNMAINATLRYGGGTFLLDETKTSLENVPIRGKHGIMSIFYHLLEQNLGVSVTTAVSSRINITPTLADVIAKGDSLDEALRARYGDPLAVQKDLLIISDFANPIKRGDQLFLKDWLIQGRPVLLMIPHDIPLESILALNETLTSFGISISSLLSTTTQASTRLGNSITKNDAYQFSYMGFAFSLDPALVRSRTLEAILSANGLPIGVSYVEPSSGARMFILGTTSILENSFILSNGDVASEDSGIIPFMMETIDWLIEPNKVPVTLMMTTTTLYLNEETTIVVRPASFFIQKALKATIESPKGDFYQVPLKYDLQTRSYETKWTPTVIGEHVLWLDVRYPGKSPHNGRFVLNVESRLFIQSELREAIVIFIIVAVLTLVGIAYWQVRKANLEEQRAFEEQIKILKKRSSLQQSDTRKHLLLNTSATSPLKTVQIRNPRNVACPRCKTPAYNEKARFCYKCGKEL